MGLRSWLVDRLVDWLTTPLARYEQRASNDPDALKRHIQKGDVLLVEGDQRVSYVIKVLTQSSWSHSALYIGDELLRRGGAIRERALASFGSDAEHLIVEALMPGVVASPLTKYVDLNVRICRPHRLRPEHLRQILDDAVAAIGWRYDLRNVFDLTRYLLPVSMVPQRWRQAALHFGSGAPTEVICSSLLGQVFGKVRFPIVPEEESRIAAPPPARGWIGRLLGPGRPAYVRRFRMRHPTLLTPRDFDLSPYFEIVKFNVIADGDFDYQRMRWDDEAPAGASAGATESISEPRRAGG